MVWVVRKVKQMLNASRKRPQIVIYTDHSVTTFIVKQTKLTTSNTDKFNFLFVRVSIYFFQFELDVKHKPGKLHVIPDALFRLPKNTPLVTPVVTDGIFDVYHIFPIVKNELFPVYHIIFVEMANDSKTRFKQVYKDNKQWKRIFEFVNPQNGENNPPVPERLRFQYRNGFIYYTNEHDDRKRFCIQKALKKSNLHMIGKIMEVFTKFMTESCLRCIYENSAVISNNTFRTALIVN